MEENSPLLKHSRTTGEIAKQTLQMRAITHLMTSHQKAHRTLERRRNFFSNSCKLTTSLTGYKKINCNYIDLK